MLHWGKDKKTEDIKTQPAVTKTSVPDTTRQENVQPVRPTTTRRTVQPDQAPKDLETALIDEGTITPEQLQQALQVQKEKGGFLGQILMDLKFLEDGCLTSFLAKQCQIPHLSLLDYLIEDDILNLIPKEVCMKHRLLAIDKMGKNLTVAMVNPLDAKALEEVKSISPNLRIKPILCANSHFEAVAEKVFGEKAEGTGEDKIVELSASCFGFSIPKPEPPKDESGSDLDKTTLKRPTESAPAETQEPAINSDALVSTCFAPPAKATEPEAGSQTDEAVSEETSMTDTTLMMRQMVTAMRNSMRDTYEVLCRRVELFRTLDPEIVAKIFAKGVTAEFNPGEHIFKKGDQGSELYVILNGKVRIESSGKVIAVLSQGDMFGEMALVSKEPRSASAITEERTSLLALSDDIIRKLLPHDAATQILINIVVTMSKRLREANVAHDS